MNKDSHFIFEAYKARLSESHPDPTQDYPPTFTSSEEISAYLDELQDGHLDNVWENICDEHGDDEKVCVKAFNEYIQNPDDSWREEDAENTGDDIMARIEQKRKERKNIGSVRGEDAETWGVEGKIKAALQEVEGVGYTGDHIDPMEVAKLVVGSQANWGDSYGPLVQALAHVVEAYYEKGLQDS